MIFCMVSKWSKWPKLLNLGGLNKQNKTRELDFSSNQIYSENKDLCSNARDHIILLFNSVIWLTADSTILSSNRAGHGVLLRLKKWFEITRYWEWAVSNWNEIFEIQSHFSGGWTEIGSCRLRKFCELYWKFAEEKMTSVRYFIFPESNESKFSTMTSQVHAFEFSNKPYRISMMLSVLDS